MRTWTVFESLRACVDSHKTVRIDTSRTTLSEILRFLFHLLTSEHLVLMTAQQGLYALLSIIHFTGASKRTVFVVIGGWLADYIADHPERNIVDKLSRLRGVHVQTLGLVNALQKHGLRNVYRFPNYRIQANRSMVGSSKTALKNLVFYSRVCPEKGIDIAVRAVQQLNELAEEPIRLDIYGPIRKDFEPEFQDMVRGAEHIRYCGRLTGDAIVPTLARYDCMVFPTHYEGEGFPGAVLESFMAGVPVIASNWKYNSEFVQDKKTGLLFENMNATDLARKIAYLRENPSLLESMSSTCREEAKRYEEAEVLPILLSNMGLVYRNRSSQGDALTGPQSRAATSKR